MDFVETEGDTIDAAIEGALKLLGVGRDKITVDIIAEGRKGPARKKRAFGPN